MYVCNTIAVEGCALRHVCKFVRYAMYHGTLYHGTCTMCVLRPPLEW